MQQDLKTSELCGCPSAPQGMGADRAWLRCLHTESGGWREDRYPGLNYPVRACVLAFFHQISTPVVSLHSHMYLMQAKIKRLEATYICMFHMSPPPSSTRRENVRRAGVCMVQRQRQRSKLTRGDFQKRSPAPPDHDLRAVRDTCFFVLEVHSTCVGTYLWFVWLVEELIFWRFCAPPGKGKRAGGPPSVSRGDEINGTRTHSSGKQFLFMYCW